MRRLFQSDKLRDPFRWWGACASIGSLWMLIAAIAACVSGQWIIGIALVAVALQFVAVYILVLQQ